MKKSILIIFSILCYGIVSSQNYCAQAESISIQPVGSCVGTPISIGADFDDQDDIAGQTNITVASACTTPAGSWNVYWATFIGNGNAVTIKLLNLDNDASAIIFENTPCGGNMAEFACFNAPEATGGATIINTIAGATYTIAVFRQTGSSSLGGNISIVDNPFNTPYYGPCDPCINGIPQSVNVHSASIDCFSDYTEMDWNAGELETDEGNPLPFDCGSGDKWEWATFTATEATTNLFLFGQGANNISFYVTQGPCSASMTSILCDDTGEKDDGESFTIPTVPGTEYFVFLRGSSSSGTTSRLCAFNDPNIPDKPFCTAGMSFEDGVGSGWQPFNGSYHLASAPGSAFVWDLNPGQVVGRFQLTSGNAIDPNIGNVLPQVAPGGGNFSFRIGSDAANAGNLNPDPIAGVVFPGGDPTQNQPAAELMRYCFTVDPNNAGFGYKYAMVMDFVAHIEEAQPEFSVTLFNNLGDTIQCGNFKHHPTDGFTQFFSVGDDGDVAGALSGMIFSPWQDVATDLSSYAGQTVCVEFRVKDCHGNADGTAACFPCNNTLTAGSHAAYAYFDTYCTPMDISAPEFCAGSAQIDICAPAGYASYDWPAGQPGMQLPYNEQCLTIANPVAGDTYTVNMTTLSGCLVTRTIILQEIPAAITNDTTICEGSSLDLSINPLGTNGPYTYSWSPGGSMSSGITVTPAITTNYAVDVTNAFGCTSTFNINVTVNTCGIEVVGNDETICEGDCTDLTAVPSGTTGAVSYSWSPNIGPGPTHNVCPLVTTDYYVTITDGTGQTATDTLTVTVNPIFNSTTNTAVCENIVFTYPDGSTSTITADETQTSTFATSAGCDSIIVTNITMLPILTTNVTQSICENATVVYPDGTSAVVNASHSQTSTLLSAEGCDSIVITTVTMLPITSSTQNIDICSSQNFTYADGTVSNNILANESHISTLVSSNACDSLVTEVLNIVSTISSTINVDICENQNYTYADGTTSFSITANESHVSTLVSGAGCDSIITENINILPTITNTIGINVCSGQGFTYADGNTSTNITSNESHTSNLISTLGCDSIVIENISVLPVYNSVELVNACENSIYTYPDGSISVIVGNESHTSNLISNAGCDSIIVTNLTMNPVYTINDGITVCTGSNYTYPDGTSSTNITVDENHTSVLSSASGCDSIIITNIVVGNSFTSSNNFNICSGNNFTYADGSVVSNVVVNETHISSFVTITGCDSLLTETLIVLPTYNLTENINACENSTVNYPDGTSATVTSSHSYTSLLQTGTGCDSTIITNVTMNPLPVFVLSFTNPTTCGAADGTISISGLNPNESYSIAYNGGVSSVFTSNSSGTILIAGLPTGAYSGFYVEDANGCSTLDNSVINIFPLGSPTIDAVDIVNLSCPGDLTGEIHVFASGGNGAISFNIDNGMGLAVTNATGDFLDLPAGSYLITISDDLGCTFTNQITINEPGNVVQNVASSNVLCFGDTNGSISWVNVSGGTAPYQFSIDDGLSYSVNSTFNGLSVGMYNVTVLDNNGCNSDTSEVFIFEPNELLLTVADIPVSNPTCVGGTPTCNGNIEINVPVGGGTAPYTYVWPNNIALNTSNVASNLCGGVFNIAIQDVNGCLSAIQVTLIEPVIPVIDDVVLTGAGCNNDCNGTISITSPTSVSYSLNGFVQTSGDFIGLCAGTYNIVVVNAQNCASSESATIENVPSPIAQYLSDPGYGTVIDPSINFENLSENASSYFWTIKNIAPTPYYYDQTQEESFTHIFPPEPGTYLICLVAMNNEGCSDSICKGVSIRDDYTIYVPNAFTPDGDAYNQVFKPVLNGIDEQNYELLIFNRWGELIFESQNKDVGWDGTFLGKTVQDGVYVWQIEFKLKYTDERIVKRGHVTILR